MTSACYIVSGSGRNKMPPASVTSWSFGSIMSIMATFMSDAFSRTFSVRAAGTSSSMSMAEVKDCDLKDFAKWYARHYGRVEVTESVFITCLCGRFHSYPKPMKEVLKRMQTLGLVTIKNNSISMYDNE